MFCVHALAVFYNFALCSFDLNYFPQELDDFNPSCFNIQQVHLLFLLLIPCFNFPVIIVQRVCILPFLFLFLYLFLPSSPWEIVNSAFLIHIHAVGPQFQVFQVAFQVVLLYWKKQCPDILTPTELPPSVQGT